MERAQSPWLINPFVDLIFGCGGLMWLIVGAHFALHWGLSIYPAGGGMAQWLLCQVFGVLLFADPHNAATVVRLYGTKELRERHSFVAIAGAVACLLLAVLAMCNTSLLALLIRIYLILIWQHLTAQAFGIALIYCGRQQNSLSKFEIRLMKFLMEATAAMVAIRQFVPGTYNITTFLNVDVPVWTPLPIWVADCASAVVVFAFLLSCGILIRKQFLKQAGFPISAALVIATPVLAAIPPGEQFGVISLYFPAFFHSSQYLLLTTFSHKKENQSGIMEYWRLLFCVGFALYFLLPFIFSLLGIAFSTAAAAIFCAVNFHHFMADSQIWKLRNPQLRREFYTGSIFVER